MSSIAYVGLDVHRDSIVAAIVSSQGEVVAERRFPNSVLKIKSFFEKWGRAYELRACYEASSCGYVLYRLLKSWGIACEVVAPSLIPRKPSDRIKTDQRDALRLARLLLAGELSAVWVPDEAAESVRSVVRLREAMVAQATASKHRILKFLRTRGHVWGLTNWSKAHRKWLLELSLEHDDRLVLDEYLGLLEFLECRIASLDKRIAEIAQQPVYREVVGLLSCFRGIGQLSAMVLVSEVGDFRRFPSAQSLMAWLGLVPSEHSSGQSQHRGSITKAGNSRARRILVEAGWHYRKVPLVSLALRARQTGQPAAVVAHSWKAQQRLNRKFWKIAGRKNSCKAVVAVARELAGFLWGAVMSVSSTAI